MTSDSFGLAEIERSVASTPGALAFAKDTQGRMMIASRGVGRVFGLSSDQDLLGRTDFDLVPAPFAEKYRRDDLVTLERARPLSGLLELFLPEDGVPAWYLTEKRPLRSSTGAVVGVTVLMRPYVEELDDADPLREAVSRMRDDLVRDDPIAHLAALSHLSVRQFEDRFRTRYRHSPSGYRIRLRVMRVCELLLGTTRSIAEIAAGTGFYDQSALARHFRAIVGMTPSRYRDHYGERAKGPRN